MGKKKVKKIKFKDLTEEHKDYIRMTYYDDELTHKEKMEILTKKFGVEGRTIRGWWLNKMNLQKESSKLPKQLIEARDRNLPSNTEVLLVTSAQNETPINHKQLASMLMYKDFLTNKLNKEANIAIIPVRYRNPTTPTEDQDKKKDMWWVDEVKNNLYYQKLEFGDTTIAADTHISPTAKNPLTSLEALANDGHLILGSFRIHFKTLPRLRNTPLRTMSTTGSITRKNYSRSKAGDTASIHHSYGFSVIELKDDGTCHVPRNVYVTDDGEFTDLCYKVTPDGVTEVDGVEAIVWGDIHREILDKNIYDKTKKLCDILKPNIHVLHDLFDGARVNPHERKDTFIRRRKIAQGKYLIEDEVNQALKFPKKVLKECGGKEVYVVQSNHDEFLDRHINDMDWKKDLHNSPAYLKYATIDQTVDKEEYGNIFGYLLYEKYGRKNKVKYLRYGDSLIVRGFNLAMHGDHGTNGSRGNITQYKRLNFKMIHGHNHTPTIMDGVTSVGLTGHVKQYYTRKGVSSHAYAHALVHKNGKRQLLVFDDNGEISDLI